LGRVHEINPLEMLKKYVITSHPIQGMTRGA